MQDRASSAYLISRRSTARRDARIQTLGEPKMFATNASGTILIRDKTLLPAGLAIEREVFLPGWKAVKNFDGYELGRKIEEADGHFFYLAGEIRVTVFGSECAKTLRRAVRRVLAKQGEQRFNSLEITKIVSKRFLGIPFMKVTAISRHIQHGIRLVPTKDAVLGLPAPVGPENNSDHGWGRHHAAETSKQSGVLVSSS